MAPATSFPLRYHWWIEPVLTVLGCGRARSSFSLVDGHVEVRMGWVFHTRIPLGSISGARPKPYGWWGIGVHGWGGHWLVNGAITGIVGLEIEPRTPARLMTVVPLRLRSLMVSLEDPDAALAALAGAGVRTSP